MKLFLFLLVTISFARNGNETLVSDDGTVFEKV